LERKINAYNVFNLYDDVKFSRAGKTVQVIGRDGTNQSTDSVEANLLYEILRELKRKK